MKSSTDRPRAAEKVADMVGKISEVKLEGRKSETGIELASCAALEMSNRRRMIPEAAV